MCYYSRTMDRREFRDAKENEDLTIQSDGHGHTVLKAASDGKIVCVMDKSTVNIENFQVNRRDLNISLLEACKPLIGKTVQLPFIEYHQYHAVNGQQAFASDSVQVGRFKVHLAWLVPGTKCYLGPKRIPLETKLGVNDPSIVHDHKPLDTIVDRVLAVRQYVCSITR